MKPFDTLRTLALPGLLLLAACGSGDAPADTSAPEGTASPTRIPSATPTPTPAADTIPAALQGRWGMVPGDCTSTLGDAKGLLTVGEKTLSFYESRASLSEVKERDDGRLRAIFAFSGEGMEWTRDVELTAEGTTLTRREYGEDAATEAYEYAKCP